MSEPKGFFTDDGYILWWEPEKRIWTDGDHVFQADADDNPLDASGKWLEGIPVPQGSSWTKRTPEKDYEETIDGVLYQFRAYRVTRRGKS